MSKHILTLLLSFISLFILYPLSAQKDLLGLINRNDLIEGKFKKWFDKKYDKYHLDFEIMEEINLHEGDLRFLVFFGSWDKDSRRELPRFLKITDSLGIEDATISLYGLDKHFTSPDKHEELWNIEYLPTFIFLYGDEELGRINEKPYISLEDDFRYYLDVDPNTFLPDSSIYKSVDEMPYFPGCYKGSHKQNEQCAKGKMLQFVYKNLKYPAIARENGIEGMVVVQFVVDEEGWIQNPRITRTIGRGCDQAVLNVIALMNEMDNRWIPGIHKGKPVKVLYTLPVKFKLEG